MKVFLVHVYDAADKLHDYYIHQRVDPDFLEAEFQRVIAAVEIERGGRRHVRCDSWRAHVDEMQVLA